MVACGTNGRGAHARPPGAFPLMKSVVRRRWAHDRSRPRCAAWRAQLGLEAPAHRATPIHRERPCSPESSPEGPDALVRRDRGDSGRVRR